MHRVHLAQCDLTLELSCGRPTCCGNLRIALRTPARVDRTADEIVRCRLKVGDALVRLVLMHDHIEGVHLG